MTAESRDIAADALKSLTESVRNVVHRRRQTGRPVIVWEDGHVVRKDPFACRLPEDDPEPDRKQPTEG